MIIYGVDFTSAPRRRKPITCARSELRDNLLCLDSFEAFSTFTEFETFLQRPGPWIAGLDFPFGQPRKLIENLGWSSDWEGYVKIVGSMTKQEFVQTLAEYRKLRPEGDKQHMRVIDNKANSRSPMMLYGVPVGKMFFEGAPRLLRSGANIVPNNPIDSDRIIVEAYPALVARKVIGNIGYKNDMKSKQTLEQRKARAKIVEGICGSEVLNFYGFVAQLNAEQAEQCIEEPGADLLDSILCAIQATWAYSNREQNYGVSAECDSLEGWIVDPEMNKTQPFIPGLQ